MRKCKNAQINFRFNNKKSRIHALDFMQTVDLGFRNPTINKTHFCPKCHI